MSSATLSPTDVATDPVRFAGTLLFVLDKQKRRTRLRYNHIQRRYLRDRTHRDIILKARQLGFSTAIQAELFRMVTTRSATTATLSHEDESTQKLRRMADRFYNNLPEEFRPARHYANATITTYPQLDSEAVIATAGNINTGRGGTYSQIHGSEVAFWRDAESLIAGIMQGGDPRWVVLESTPNGAQGWFYETCLSALDGDSAWKLHFYPWFIEPQYAMPLDEGETLEYTNDEAALVHAHNLTPEQIKWRRNKKRELKHLFLQEYPEDPKTCFLLSGVGYFGDIHHALTAPMNATPQPGTEYVAGLDFAQTVDYTALSIGNRNTLEQVELARFNRLPWQEQRRRIVDRCKFWGVRTLVAEANSIGAPNIEALVEEMRSADCDTTVISFQTSAITKPPLIAGMHEALHNVGLTLLPDRQQAREFHAYTATQLPSGVWRYEAAAGEHDDTVIASALMWHAMNTKPIARVQYLRRGR